MLKPEVELWGRIVRLAGPVILAMLTQTAINIMDTIMVGWLDPSYSIAGQSALGYSLPLLWSVGGFLAAISVGTQAITARRFGEGKSTLAGKTLTNSITIAAIAGLIASIGAYLAVPYVFPLLNDNESVLAFGVPYAQYRVLGVLSMVATISYKSWFDGIGQTHVHMVAALIMNALNIVLNYALIFGWGPFPQMHVAGAGLASLLSTYVGLALMIGWSFKPHYRRQYTYYKLKNFSKKISWSIIRLSLPSGFATVFVMSGFLMFFKIVGLLDEGAVEATLSGIAAYSTDMSAVVADAQHQILDATGFHGRVFMSDLALMSIEARPPIYTSATKVITDVLSITFMSAMAFGTATATLVSQSMGRGEPDLAERYGWESVKLGMILFGFIGVLSFIWPEHALGLLSNDPAVIEAGVPSMRIMAALEAVVAGALILTQALFGAGESKFVMIVEMILHIVCLVPLSYVLGITLGFGLIGIWSAAGVYVVVLGIVMAIKFYRGGWKETRV